jgi:hypothetical protein
MDMTAGVRSIGAPHLIAMSKELRGVEAGRPKVVAITDKKLRPKALGPGRGPCSFDRDK